MALAERVDTDILEVTKLEFPQDLTIDIIGIQPQGQALIKALRPRPGDDFSDCPYFQGTITRSSRLVVVRLLTSLLRQGLTPSRGVDRGPF